MVENEQDIIRAASLEWINDYCGQAFIDGELPGGVELALRRLVKSLDTPVNVASQSVSDVSVSFFRGTDGTLPTEVKRLLEPYIKMRTI